MTAFPGISRYLSISTLLDFKFFTLIGFIAPKVNLQRNCKLQSRGFSSKGTSMQLIFPHSKAFENVSRHFLQKLPLPKRFFLKVIDIKHAYRPHIKARVTEILWVLSCSPCNVSHSQAQAGVGPPQTLCRSSKEGKLNAHVFI